MDIVFCGDTFASARAMLRERLVSMPGKIAASCGMREQREVEEVMRDEVYELLEELSEPIRCLDGYT